LRFKGIILLVVGIVGNIYGQVVSLNPTFPSQTDTVTITYDATQGNAALAGQSVVYAHMGLITSSSQSPSDWKYVIGEWGTPDPDVLMTNIGDNKFTKTYDIADFHGIPPGETVLKLAFVFRTADGSVVGRDVDGSDIFVDLFQGSYAAAIITPTFSPVVVEAGDTLEVQSSASVESNITLTINDNFFDSANNAKDLISRIPVDDFGSGKFWVKMTASNGNEILTDSFYYVLPGDVNVEDPPAGIDEGVNALNDSTVVFYLYAPFKDYVYVIGDFNNWELDTAYFMNQSEDGDYFWLTVSGLDPDKEYRFQYQIEEQLRIADVYSEKILDPWNDPFIDESTYPNLTPYPVGQTNDPVSTFIINKPVFDWDNSIDYQKPDKENLVIYELLLRDFLDDHSYKGLRDTLDYLEKLGVTALNIMPFNEFEGNDSWGYNPSFYFAPDKYYGPAEELKKLIEECHRRDIAVIMDMVLNHSFGQSPMVRMYFDPAAGSFGQPTPENPWFNPVPKHDFNVGYDFNHESEKTKEFVDKVLSFWVTEYRIDGYRMDLSKGFTQVNSLGDVGKWGQRDDTRIAIWERIRDELWKVDSSTYIILEHFADNEEETILSDMGFMIWGNCNGDYRSAAKGSIKTLACPSYQRKNWNDPHLIGYMESHDEERVMYDVQNFGFSGDDYDTKDLKTSLKRAELAANFLFPIPGPKMIWQFGELGFDYSINTCEDLVVRDECRLSRKPIRWDYYDVPERKRIYDVYSELIRLKKEYEVFKTENYDIQTYDFINTVTLDGAEMDVVVLGNFGLENTKARIPFPSSGTWYEFYTRDSILVEDSINLTMVPGEYRLYSTIKLPGIFNDTAPEIDERPPFQTADIKAYPNPFNGQITLGVTIDIRQIAVFQIFNIYGQKVWERRELLRPGYREIIWDGANSEGQKLPSGQYILRVETVNGTKELPLVLLI
jgi:glycosidase